MKEMTYDRTQYDNEALGLFFWSKIMSDMTGAQQTHGASWGINVNEAMALHGAVEKDYATPPSYHILGADSLLAASSSQTGDNCYSWARRKVRSLGDQNITNDTRLQKKATDFIVHQTTRHIKPPQDQTPEPTSPCCVM